MGHGQEVCHCKRESNAHQGDAFLDGRFILNGMDARCWAFEVSIMVFAWELSQTALGPLLQRTLLGKLIVC